MAFAKNLGKKVFLFLARDRCLLVADSAVVARLVGMGLVGDVLGLALELLACEEQLLFLGFFWRHL